MVENQLLARDRTEEVDLHALARGDVRGEGGQREVWARAYQFFGLMAHRRTHGLSSSVGFEDRKVDVAVRIGAVVEPTAGNLRRKKKKKE